MEGISPRPKPRFSPRPEAVNAILTQRSRFQNFLTTRVSNHADAESLLQRSMPRAIESGGNLRRGESAVAWFHRILRYAVTDHYGTRACDDPESEGLWNEWQASSKDRMVPTAVWDATVCTCFRGLLPSLKPRYAHVIQRIDLDRESKVAVARDLKIKRATLDVVVHRARSALRDRLVVLCGAYDREQCVKCLAGKTHPMKSNVCRINAKKWNLVFKDLRYHGSATS